MGILAECQINLVCDDGNPCTIDICKDNVCVHENNQGNCSDGYLNTVNDTCLDGVCKGQVVECLINKDCQDWNPCTVDNCVNNTCLYDPLLKNNTECNDNDPTTYGDICLGGLCKGKKANCYFDSDCNDGNWCTQDICGVDHVCQNTAWLDYKPCNDGNSATINDHCTAGVCAGVYVECKFDSDCDDGNICTVDFCNDDHECEYGYNTVPCDDGYQNIIGDTCHNGFCVGTVIQCQFDNDCWDYNYCTQDLCVAGYCEYSSIALNGVACTDYDSDTIGDKCVNGLCLGYTVECEFDNECDDHNECTIDACIANICTFTDDDGRACNDHDSKTILDTCTAGVCAGKPVACQFDKECNDGNECTDDVCVNNTCQYTFNNNPCVDGFLNTINDTCLNGICVGTVVGCIVDEDCRDWTLCTVDRCDNNKCVYTLTGTCFCVPNSIENCIVPGQQSPCALGQHTCAPDGSAYGECISLNVPQLEICFDGINNDCDNETDENCECDPSTDVDVLCETGLFGQCHYGTMDCLPNSKGFTACVSTVLPTVEICINGLDDDCDGEADEDCICNSGDSRACGISNVGVCKFGNQICVAGNWGVCSGNIDPTQEICNGLDDDCNGIIPPNERDADFDGYMVCDGDLNDTDPTINPGVPEICDGIDNDSDGAVDENWYIGQLCTGIGACGLGVYECNGLNDSICSTMPGASEDQSAPESCINNIDDDCDGSINEGCICMIGQERDCGSTDVGQCRFGKQYCQPGAFWGICQDSIEPIAELCNGLDDDCNGSILATEIDADGDGYMICEGDCNDSNAQINPGMIELCSTVADDNCNGLANEGCQCTPGATLNCTTTLFGRCSSGRQTCLADGKYGPCVALYGPIEENCANNIDDDCDILVNDGCVCTPNSVAVCLRPESGLCATGHMTCNATGTGYGACVANPALGDRNPGDVAESCNKIDDDCDGLVDEGGVCGVPVIPNNVQVAVMITCPFGQPVFTDALGTHYLAANGEQVVYEIYESVCQGGIASIIFECTGGSTTMAMALSTPPFDIRKSDISGRDWLIISYMDCSAYKP